MFFFLPNANCRWLNYSVNLMCNEKTKIEKSFLCNLLRKWCNLFMFCACKCCFLFILVFFSHATKHHIWIFPLLQALPLSLDLNNLNFVKVYVDRVDYFLFCLLTRTPASRITNRTGCKPYKYPFCILCNLQMVGNNVSNHIINLLQQNQNRKILSATSIYWRKEKGTHTQLRV